jgi:hypothetical protein
MNMVIAYASMALIALVGFLFFKFLDWKDSRHDFPANR